ncbi:MAG: helix-turn-helix transcriptional regulator [Oscillospiraceae bacterium]|nr:helix-turn-helix transcriptional regulator [Oscillospiraceae bacterium]MBR3849557.1 helix-turn-helix transcriptional regulator [Oscillospiraceae bacterium]
MKSAKEIGKDLVALRGDSSREYVANAVGVSVSALQMYENGERRPRDETKCALAKLFHTTVGALFFGEKVHEM